MDPIHSILAQDTALSTRNHLYGFIVGIAMLAWFFGASYLGDLSDQVGRKKSLMVCLIGAFFGYVASALGVIFTSITLLLVGRIVAGLTAGSQAIAQAAIISLLNAVLLQFLFHETFYKTDKVKVKLYRAVEILVLAFKHHKVRNLSLILLIMNFGWSGYYMFTPTYLLQKYSFQPLEIGIFLALMGLGFAVGTGLLVNYVTLRFSLKNIVIVSLLLTMLFAVLIILSSHILCAWLAVATEHVMN